MNDEGISSVAVVDNHSNVVGNISVTDVKVCIWYTRGGTTELIGRTAPYALVLTSAPSQYVYTLHLRDSFRSRSSGWQRFIPGISCEPGVDSGSYRCQSGSHQITPVSLLPCKDEV
jgi:hypothetical protein